MIFELPNFISQEELDYINLEVSKYYNDPKISKERDGSYRDGKSILISQTSELKELDNYIFKILSSDKLQSFISRRYYPMYETADTGYEFHRYEPGGCCHVHFDGEVLFKTNDLAEGTFLRFASVVLHLNTPTSGGELIFPSLNKTIKTEAGKLVIFPPYGFAQHYTNQSSENRDVIVTWFVYKNLVVQQR